MTGAWPRTTLLTCGAATIQEASMPVQSHQEYLAQVPATVRPRLGAIGERVATLVPGATPCLSYAMPAWRDARVFLYVGAFRHHIGIYPPLPADDALSAALAPWRNARGNLAFAHAAPLPLDLIGQVVLALHRRSAAG
jgi:uncharacterized protein YdhG (YjbR/CyaY superfamily)